MVRKEGPLCPSGHPPFMQKRIYQRRSIALNKQRFEAYAWLCMEDGEVHHYEDVPENYLPMTERKRRREGRGPR